MCISCSSVTGNATTSDEAGAQFDFISMSLSFSVCLSESSEGSSPNRGKGNKELRLHRIIRAAKLSKLSFVMPNTWVKPAPIKPPKTLPAFDIDINVAKSVASTPSGQSLAANTSIGINEICNGESDEIQVA